MYDRSKCEIIPIASEFNETGVPSKGIPPAYTTIEAAAADIAIPYEITIPAKSVVYVDLLLRTNIEIGNCLLMFPRSSLLIKHGLFMPVSVIDSDYKLNIHVPMYNVTDTDVTLEKGTRVAQVMLQDCHNRVTSNFTNEINEIRQGGCGSTGTKVK